MDMRKIGILAVTPEGATKAFRDLSIKCYQIFGEYKNPEILLYMQSLDDHVNSFGDQCVWRRLIQEGVDTLCGSGCDLIWMPANSSHLVIDEINFGQTQFVNMVNDALAYLGTRSHKTLLMGTNISISEKLYLSDRYNLEHCVSLEQADQQRINDIIVKELILGRISDNSRGFILDLIKLYKVSHGIEEVFFACTELPCFFNERELGIKVSDSISVSIESLMSHIS